MTKETQNFKTYAGDDALPEFYITGVDDLTLDISSVNEIIWQAQRDLESAVVLEKKKTALQITFPNSGTDGKFRVALLAADTALLSGYYIHRAIIVDGHNNRSTVTLGRFQVGRMPVSAYSGDPSISTKDAVRYRLGDTDASNWMLSDQEINYSLTIYPNPLRAAASCARTLSARYARRVSKRVGDLAINYSDMAKNFADLATVLDREADRQAAIPYIGGISQADVDAVESDTDRRSGGFRQGFGDFAPDFNDPDSGWSR